MIRGDSAYTLVGSICEVYGPVWWVGCSTHEKMCIIWSLLAVFQIASDTPKVATLQIPRPPTCVALGVYAEFVVVEGLKGLKGHQKYEE